MASLIPSSSQIRAALALLHWENRELSTAAGISVETVINAKSGATQLQPRIREKIRHALESQGILFIGASGVDLRDERLRTFKGVDGFSQFHDTVYNHLKDYGGRVCVAGSSSEQFALYRRNPEVHRLRMTELARQRKDIDFRILAEEGDTNLPNTGYALYRWQPRDYFTPVAFYAFGDYLGLISFDTEEPPHIILIRSPVIAESYRKSFDLAWQHAKDIPPKRI